MKKIIYVLLLFILYTGVAKAQSQYLPYSYQFYQKFNEDVYSTKTRVHSSLKPFFADDSLLQRRYNELMNLGVDTTVRHGWVHRKLFNEHLIEVNNKDYTFYADFIGDYSVGRDFSGNKTTWTNNRGYQIGGTIGKNFYFYSRGFENQAVFPQYMSTYIAQVGIVPGQAYDRSYGKKSYTDWSDVTALVSYTPVKYLNVTLGHDKNFIGDGYRSQLLSDYASPYPFLKLTANVGNVKYMAMWSYMVDPAAPYESYTNGYKNKWGVFHYLDWNITNRLSVGFFDAIIWGNVDKYGNYRGFEFGYANPVVFLRPVEASSGSPDNALIGFTSKYKLTDGITVYGQFALDEFEAKNFFSGKGSSRNKYGYQIGVRGANLFKVKSLNYLLEYNGATPYTYSETDRLINYSQQGEPLAHPFGANYKELIGLLNYSYKRFDFSGQVQYAQYGLDVSGLNYGKDIFRSYATPARLTGNYIGQGLTTNLYYAQAKVAYLINPKYNLRLEFSALFRRERNHAFLDRTSMFSIGLRSSFRTIYSDLASFRAH
jgi:hypothetical protein